MIVAEDCSLVSHANTSINHNNSINNSSLDISVNDSHKRKDVIEKERIRD